MSKKRKIFFVLASGGHDTDQHYQDTIKNKRTVAEASRFLQPHDADLLNQHIHEQPYAVWGAVPGSGNIRTWGVMEPGDYVIIYKNGKIILAAEVAIKAKNANLARYFWGEDRDGKTWEYMFFLINDVEVNVKQSDLNKYLGYKENYFPRGFAAIDQEKANRTLSLYGDLISLLQKLERGEKVEEIDIEKRITIKEFIEEKIEKAPTEHDEMQWRLIRLGNKSHFDVWVPKADQGRQYEGNVFKNFVIQEFHESIDIPISIKNIDTVWKLGLSIKAAFEIEHSTSIYSGILRLSDLKTLAPNSNYPLFIVADRDKKAKVFDQLQRPTFSSDYLRLDKTVKFLEYDAIRNMDENLKEDRTGFEIDWLLEKAEALK